MFGFYNQKSRIYNENKLFLYYNRKIELLSYDKPKKIETKDETSDKFKIRSFFAYGYIGDFVHGYIRLIDCIYFMRGAEQYAFTYYCR